MNQAMRWKRFIDWWEVERFKGMSRADILYLIQDKIDELREGRK